MKRNFLTAEWRKLAIANYAIDPGLLQKYLPAHTELDYFNGQCLVSLIGFMFLNTKVMGVKVPFHSNFEEVNLRFYVKHLDNGEYKRGVVFIKEIVPKPAITFVANTLYGEPYHTMPMRHSWKRREKEISVEYGWRRSRWNVLAMRASVPSQIILPGSEEEFITEHYWGFTRRKNGKTSAYEVGHPKWEVYPVIDYTVNADFKQLYGSEFAFLSEATPTSVFLAEGSEIFIKQGVSLKK